MKARFVALALALAAIAPCVAQDRGGITGTVRDSSGAAVTNAPVEIINRARGEQVAVRTTDAGVFSATSLIPGLYDITVEVPGFRTTTVKGVEVRVGDTSRADVHLQLGSVTETVNVSGEAAPLKVDTSDVGTTVSTEAILNLPLQVGGAVRDPLAFARLTPGFTGNTANSAVEYQTYYTINGGQSGATQILVDGADVELTSVQSQFHTGVSVEAVEEFKVMSSNFSAEYGRSTGGIINLTLKSGTNSFHGSAYDFLRNDVMDARGFFNAERQPNRQNDFGTFLSGPVWIPKVYNGHDKTFFTFAWEGFKYRAGALNQLGTYPIEPFRHGDFSRLVDASGVQIPIYDPATTVVAANGTVTRQQFPGNKIPENRFDPVVAKILPMLPKLDFPDRLTNNIFTKNQNVVDTNIFTTKIDHLINSKHRIGGSYSQAEENNQDLWAFGALGQTGAVDSRTTYARANYDAIISPQLLNHVQYGFSRRHFNQGTPFQGDYVTQLGLKGVANQIFPTIDINGYQLPGGDTFGGGGFGQLFTGVDNSFQLNDTVSLVRGRHSFKFGGEMRKQQWNVNDRQLISGLFSFDSGQTGLPAASSTTGDAFASFLLGQVSGASYGYTGNQSAHRFASMSFFTQDDYKVNSKLTLNLGLRYDRFWPLTDATNRLSTFSPATPNPGAGGRPGALIFAGTGPGRSGITRFQKIYNKAFGPRIGLAYQLSERTVFRAGYGVYYQELKEPGWGGSNAGFFALPSFSSPDGFNPAFVLGDGFPTNFPKPPFLDPSFSNGQNVSFGDPEPAHLPTSQNWQASIERQLGHTFVLDVAYVATKGNHLITRNKIYNQVDPKYLALGPLLNADINSPEARAAGILSPYPGFTGPVKQALRPYPQYKTISGGYVWGSDKTGNSTYHALQTKLQGRLGNSLNALVTYTWSKNLTDGSNNRDLDNYSPNFGGVQDGYNLRAEKTYAGNDIPHSLVGSLLYNLPFGQGHRFLSGGVTSRLLGGWSIGSVLTYQSGMMILTPSPASKNVPLFAGSIRPDVVPGVPVLTSAAKGSFDPERDRYFNAAAWKSPAPYHFGNAARMSGARTKPMLNEDVSLLKDTGLTERVKLQFRAEAFNVFNRVVFGFPQRNLGSSDFGQIFTQQNKPRVLQLGLKLLF